MTERERFDRVVRGRQPPHPWFFERRRLSRRYFFRNTLTGVEDFFLADRIAQGAARLTGSITPRNTVRVLDKIAIIRSGLAWARAHPLTQVWMQTGRNPTSATGRFAPLIGSVVAIEKEPERQPSQKFPPFIAFDAQRLSGHRYSPTELGPLQTSAATDGLVNTKRPGGPRPLTRRWNLLQTIDSDLRGEESPLGAHAASMGRLYENAKQLMFNPVLESAFRFTPEESQRYGNSSFGDAALTARTIVEQDQGTRFFQIELDGWDHYEHIYSSDYETNSASCTIKCDTRYGGRCLGWPIIWDKPRRHRPTSSYGTTSAGRSTPGTNRAFRPPPPPQIHHLPGTPTPPTPLVQHLPDTQDALESRAGRRASATLRTSLNQLLLALPARSSGLRPRRSTRYLPPPVRHSPPLIPYVPLSSMRHARGGE